MKMATIRLLVSLALPLSLKGLLLRSYDSPPQDKRIACGAGHEKKNGLELAYETAFLKAYYETASVKLFQANGEVSDQFRKLDTDGNGVLDCSELGMKHLDAHHLELSKTEAKDEAKKVERKETRRDQKELVDAVKRQVDELEHQADRVEHLEHKDLHKEVDDLLNTKLSKLSNENRDDEAEVARLRAEVHRLKDKAKAKAGPAQCVPKCTWRCGTQKCDQVCKPQCQTPQCQTRCSGMSTTGCKMECGQPRCTSVCNQGPCPKKDCPVCQTQCGKPLCKLVCPAGVQNCRDVCENPACTWACTKPLACPQPACSLTCDSAKNCADSSYKELPALKAGETIVESFPMPQEVAPAVAFQQQGVNRSVVTLPVAVLRTVAVPGSSEFKLERSTVRLPVVMEGE